MDKEIFALIAILLTLFGYIPYIIDTIKEKTTPHMYSWLVWVSFSITNTALFFQNGGGNASYILLSNLILTTIIFILSIFRGHKDIKRIDKVFLAISIIAFLLWFVIKLPVISAILSTATSLIALGPTIRKSWDTPQSETLSTYILNTIRQALTVFSISTYSLITVLNPLLWTFGNLLVGLILIYRRWVLKKSILI